MSTRLGVGGKSRTQRLVSGEAPPLSSEPAQLGALLASRVKLLALRKEERKGRPILNVSPVSTGASDSRRLEAISCPPPGSWTITFSSLPLRSLRLPGNRRESRALRAAVRPRRAGLALPPPRRRGRSGASWRRSARRGCGRARGGAVRSAERPAAGPRSPAFLPLRPPACLPLPRAQRLEETMVFAPGTPAPRFPPRCPGGERGRAGRAGRGGLYLDARPRVPELQFRREGREGAPLRSLRPRAQSCPIGPLTISGHPLPPPLPLSSSTSRRSSGALNWHLGRPPRLRGQEGGGSGRRVVGFGLLPQGSPPLPLAPPQSAEWPAAPDPRREVSGRSGGAGEGQAVDAPEGTGPETGRLAAAARRLGLRRGWRPQCLFGAGGARLWSLLYLGYAREVGVVCA